MIWENEENPLLWWTVDSGKRREKRGWSTRRRKKQSPLRNEIRDDKCKAKLLSQRKEERYQPLNSVFAEDNKTRKKGPRAIWLWIFRSSSYGRWKKHATNWKSKHLKGLDSFLSWERGRERKGAIMQVSDDWTGKDSQFCVFSLLYFHLQGDDNEDGEVSLVYWWTLVAIFLASYIKRFSFS